MSRTALMRSSGVFTSSMLTVASAPNLRASFSRGASGAPTQITRPAPISCAAATARIPIRPQPNPRRGRGWETAERPRPLDRDRVAPLEAPRLDRAVERADARCERLGERAEPQVHVVGQLVNLGARQHVEIDVDVFGPAAPQ